MCDARLGSLSAFYGDLRELYLLNNSVEQDALTPDFVHQVQSYHPLVLGYYRLGDTLE